MIEIKEVKTKKGLKKFICFPEKLYEGDPNYVRELNVIQRAMFNKKKNPFFKHSKVDFFLAYKSKKLLGRIAVIRNNVHIKYQNEDCGFFGFFETIEEYDVAKSLLDTAVNWVRSEHLTCLMGPENFTTNDSCGMLYSGFDSPPIVMMPYNKAYYNIFLERYGFKKAMDLSSYYLSYEKILTPQLYNIILESNNIKLNGSGIKIRNINYKNLDSEIEPMREVYNQSNRNNWGFIPLNETEFKETANIFKLFVPEKLMLLAEKDNQTIGFIVALPDINQVFSHIRSGKLFPFGLLKFIWYKKKINRARILILGILEEYRNRGIDLALYKKIQENLASMGIYQGEACYVMENNFKMNSIIEKIGGIKIKNYRLYKYEMKTN